MIARAESLYTLPAVAMEVIRLTDTPDIDTRALKECIEQDPALAAKVLRVVNSSLFGLSGNVENLTQAIALLGTGPLKLLVLGFSLPDNLLKEIDVQQLRAYWRGALTRAVAARQLAERLWELPGDDAFLVALLQDIGLLVLLQQLGNPYAKFLSQVRAEKQDLLLLERESLGFDHRALTATLLKKWKLPKLYTDSIEQSPAARNTVGSDKMTQVVPQVLRLAALVVELVDGHRLCVLPELLESGQRYGGLDKDSLHELVAELEPQVDQLAGVLQVDLGDGGNYEQVLASAHQQLAIVAEQAAGELLASETLQCEEILEESQELARAMQRFTGPPTARSQPAGERADSPALATPRPRGRTLIASPEVARDKLGQQVAKIVAGCRADRQALSLMRVEGHIDPSAGALPEGALREIHAGTRLKNLLEQLRNMTEAGVGEILRLERHSFAWILPNHDRHEAVALAQRAIAKLASEVSAESSTHADLKIGVAALANVPKSFDAERLIDAANNCLAAALASGGDTIKSIEVY